MHLTLYSYFRSSASWRVRIALALKGLPHDYVGVHLARNDHFGHAQLGPAQQLPALALPDGAMLTQSLAILEYLDEVHPTPPLLPSSPLARAQARALAQDIAVDTHPLQNLRVLRYLIKPVGASEDAKTEWAQHWIARGLGVVEAKLQGEGHHQGRFCMGDTPGYADCVLVPQLYNAERFGLDLSPYPAVRAVQAACMALPAFAQTHPSQVPDAQ